MSVAFNASSKSHPGTTGSQSESSFSWLHTPAGSPMVTPSGVSVFVMAKDSSNLASSVTYGGTSVPAVSGAEAADTVGELGYCKMYHLGSSVPAGAQNVQVNRTNNASWMFAVCYTWSANGDTEIVGVSVLQEDQVLGTVNIDDGSPGSNSVRVAAVASGANVVNVDGDSSTLDQQMILSSVYSFTSVHETTAGQGSRPVGFSASTDDVAAVFAAVVEIGDSEASDSETVDLTDSFVAELIKSATFTESFSANDAEAATNFAISGVSPAGPFQPGDSFDLSYSGADGAVTVYIGDQSIGSGSSSPIACTVPLLQTHGTAGNKVKYGPVSIRANDGVSDSLTTQTISVPDGFTQDILTAIATGGIYDELGVSDVEFGVDVAVGGITAGDNGSVPASINKATGEYSTGDQWFQYTVWFFDDSAADWVGVSSSPTGPFIFTANLVHEVSISESIQTSENLSTLYVGNALFSESVLADDVANTTLDSNAFVSDALGIQDYNNFSTAILASFVESVQISEIIQSDVSIEASASDGISAFDSNSTLAEYECLVSDSFNQVDQGGAPAILYGVVEDLIAINDGYSANTISLTVTTPTERTLYVRANTVIKYV